MHGTPRPVGVIGGQQTHAAHRWCGTGLSDTERRTCWQDPRQPQRCAAGPTIGLLEAGSTAPARLCIAYCPAVYWQPRIMRLFCFSTRTTAMRCSVRWCCIAAALGGAMAFSPNVPAGESDVARADVGQAAGTLEEGFRQPPAWARPWVYWFWLNGNITAEGITADLEALKRVGVGGVLIMEVDQGVPVGKVGFMSDAWRALFRHVVQEAGRLGLEVNMNNDAGWNGSGGPWIKPEESMQKVVFSEIEAAGPKAPRSPPASARDRGRLLPRYRGIGLFLRRDPTA